jgi:hypothetical protein
MTGPAYPTSHSLSTTCGMPRVSKLSMRFTVLNKYTAGCSSRTKHTSPPPRRQDPEGYLRGSRQRSTRLLRSTSLITPLSRLVPFGHVFGPLLSSFRTKFTRYSSHSARKQQKTSNNRISATNTNVAKTLSKETTRLAYPYS